LEYADVRGGGPRSPGIQNLIIIQQQPWLADLPLSKQEEIGPSKVTEYKSAASESARSNEQNRTFTLVVHDGTQFNAVAVMIESPWVLRYIDTDGRHRRIVLADINREATQTVNAATGLRAASSAAGTTITPDGIC
jgi:hypothetical protein